MRVPPPDLDPSSLREALTTGWGFAAETLEYLPVGFGSHHWLATDASGTRRFVTVDVLTAAGGQADLARLTAAFGTAYALRHRAGLERVVAPLADLDGTVLQVVEAGFVVTVFEHLDAAPWPDDEQATPADDKQVADLVSAVHGATPSVDGVAGVDDLAIPHRHGLKQRLGGAAGPWADGPYSGRARTLLADHALAVTAGLHAYDRAADELRGRRTSWVLTHGEPHSDNLLRGPSGPLLLDWDTALVAPAGRDLWMLRPAGVAHYRATTGRAVPDAELDAYRLRWDLAEVAEYVRWFAEPHEADEDAAIAWGGLCESFENLAARDRSGGGGI